MIKSLHITNFQSHKNTYLEFHNGVNVVLGVTDSGKSSLFRAMNWLINNRPTGESFRSNWGGDTNVFIELNEDINIVRKRTKKENVYYIHDKEDPVEFKAIKTDVPDEIKTVLNMSSINIQRQLDSHFLLSNTSGETSKFLNKIVNLDKIDIALKNAETDKRQTNGTISSMELFIEQELTEIKKYNNIKEIDEILTGLEKEQSQIDIEDHEIDLLKDLISDISALDRKKKSFENLAEIEKIYWKLDKDIQEIQVYDDMIQELSAILDEIDLNMTSKKNLKSKIKELEKKYNNIMPEVCPLCQQRIQ